jgi:hypothetical protein
MTDNGSPYVSHVHAAACRELQLKHLRTQPYRPRTNGKAERFIQTLQREWAYGRVFQNSAQRTAALNPWLTHYNFKRPHSALSHKPPSSRLTNAPRNYTGRLRRCGSLVLSRPNGDVAEWLRSGLQSRLHRFDSGRRLTASCPRGAPFPYPNASCTAAMPARSASLTGFSSRPPSRCAPATCSASATTKRL